MGVQQSGAHAVPTLSVQTNVCWPCPSVTEVKVYQWQWKVNLVHVSNFRSVINWCRTVTNVNKWSKICILYLRVIFASTRCNKRRNTINWPYHRDKPLPVTRTAAPPSVSSRQASRIGCWSYPPSPRLSPSSAVALLVPLHTHTYVYTYIYLQYTRTHAHVCDTLTTKQIHYIFLSYDHCKAIQTLFNKYVFYSGTCQRRFSLFT